MNTTGLTQLEDDAGSLPPRSLRIMSDPLSLAAGVIGITAFAIQSSKVLYDALGNLKNNVKNVRDLKEEITSLSAVLQSLKETLEVSDTDFSSLQAPLLRCARLCLEFSEVVEKCSAHADKGKFSVRDYLMATYKGKDINDLRSLLSVYKSTITIALADANLRQVTITAKVLQEYKQTINDTTCDLGDLLNIYKVPPEDLASQGPTSTKPEDGVASDIAEERVSILECLRICATVSKHIDDMQKESSFLQTKPRTIPHAGVLLTRTGEVGHITTQGLQHCQAHIRFTSAELRLRLKEVDYRLARLSKRSSNGGNPLANGDKEIDVEEEMNAIRDCLSICQGATEQMTKERINVFEDVDADHDVDQVIVSTFGDLVSAKCIKVGARSTQLLGQMSDDSLQHIFREITVRQNQREAQEKKSNNDPSYSRFTGSYGEGQSLNETRSI